MARKDMLIINFEDYRLQSEMLDTNFSGNWVYIGGWTNEQVTRGPLANIFASKEREDEPGSSIPTYRKWLWEAMQAGNTFILKDLSKMDVTSTVLVDHFSAAEIDHSAGPVINRAVKYINSAKGRHLKMSDEQIAKVPRFTVNWPRTKTNLRWKQNVKPPPTPADSRMPIKNGDYISLHFDGKSHRHAEVMQIHYDQSKMIVVGIDDYGEPVYGNRFPITHMLYRIHAINMQLVWSDEMPGRVELHQTLYDSTALSTPAGRYIPTIGDKVEVWDRHGNGESGIVKYVYTDDVICDAGQMHEERVSSIELTSTATGSPLVWQSESDGGGFKVYG